MANATKSDKDYTKKMKPPTTPPIPPINDIPWLTKPRKLESSKRKQVQPAVKVSEKKHNSEKPAAASSSTSITTVLTHKCPRCGRTGNNDLNLHFILCNKCTEDLAKGPVSIVTDTNPA